MKLLFVLVALSLAGAVPGVQSCCDAPGTLFSDGAKGALAFQRDLHFDRVPEVLSPAQSAEFSDCVKAWVAEALAAGYNVEGKWGYPEYRPRTYGSPCNMFNCHCDHCYGDEDCMGTSDGDPNEQFNRWQLGGPGWHFCPALRTFDVPGFKGVCATAASSAASPNSTAPAITAAERACSDRDKVLGTPLPELTATLSSLYCASAGGSVGLEFTSSLLASLDADGSGSVDCAEWGIAKQTTELHQLPGGGYFGPPKLEAPLCKLTAEGKDKIARHNAYLGKLTLGTLAANATALAASAASRAVLTVENEVVAGSAAGALLAARDKVAAAWNATKTMTGSG